MMGNERCGGGRANELKPSSKPLRLPKVDKEPDYRWAVRGDKGLLIFKDGVIQVERCQYGRTAAHRFTSNSMAKSITAAVQLIT